MDGGISASTVSCLAVLTIFSVDFFVDNIERSTLHPRFYQVTGACHTWSPLSPSSWELEPSLTTRRAFAHLVEVNGRVLAVGGLDGTLSPLAFRQVRGVRTFHLKLQTVSFVKSNLG